MSELVSEARRLADRATPGPWRCTEDFNSLIDGFVERYVVIDESRDTSNLSRPDAEFIAWCREGVPALLSRLARVRELHPEVWADPDAPYCDVCGPEVWITHTDNPGHPSWPCPTVAALGVEP